MAGTYKDLLFESFQIATQILEYKDIIDVEAAKKSVRQKVILGEEIDQDNPLVVLLKREYELEREIDKETFRFEWGKSGKDVNSPQLEYECELQQIKKDLSVFPDEAETLKKGVRQNIVLGIEIDGNNPLAGLLKKEYELERKISKDIHLELQQVKEDLSLVPEEAEALKKDVRQNIVLGKEIDTKNPLAVILKREYELEREINKENFRLEWIKAGKDVKSPQFNPELQLQQLKNDLSLFEEDEIKDARKEVRERVSKRVIISTNNILSNLLLNERQLERTIKRFDIEESYVKQGYDKNSELFKNSVELDMLHYDMQELDPDTFEEKKHEYEELKQSGLEKDSNDSYIMLLRKEDQLQAYVNGIKRAEKLFDVEESYLKQGYDRNSDLFNKSVELDMLHEDMKELKPELLEAKRLEYEELKQKGLEKDSNDSYIILLRKEDQLQADIDGIKKAAEEKESNIDLDQLREKLFTEQETEKPKRTFGSRLAGLFRRKPKEEPAKTEAVAEEPVVAEAVKEETKEEKTNETVTKEKTETKDKEIKDPSREELEENLKKEKEERDKAVQERKRKKEEEQQRKYRVEFAGKDLAPLIRNCGNIEQIAEQLEKNQNLSDEQKEHLQKRIGAIAKVQALETSRAIKQKKRPPCIKYNDGTILLKNKKRDVAKQTTMNGCWSAVLSDMLGHFGVDLTQEEIRAYRPDLAAEMANKDVNAFMERLNRDEANEINAMADLIQRVVPNVAQHHMSIDTRNPANKEVVKEVVKDALMNKNSPVAVCYKGHYMSIVGIKENTLIVQNPDPKFSTKYQRLDIKDLFAAGGQVTLDWLEDLKFTKEGTCKNITSQWESMGIKCNNREFAAGRNPNQPLHLKGNEYYDSYRLSQGIEETIYMPKMSFGKEKDLEQKEINKNQTENIIKGNLNIEDVQLNVMKLDDNEITNEHEENIEIGRTTI